MISKIFKHFLIILTFSLPILSFSKPIDDISFMTENYPPYNFKHNNKLQGISVDLLELMFKKLESKKSIKDIRLLPWARSYYNLQNIKNSALFSMTRTKQREHLFKWVGPISPTTISLISKKSHHIKIDSVNDIMKYKIGVVRDDIGEQTLIELGISSKQLDDVGGINALDKLIKMLDKDRFDMLAYEENVRLWKYKKMGLDPKLYEVVYQLKKASLYFAFHKDTSDKLIIQLQNLLDKIKEEGKYQKIIDKYLK